MLNKFSYDYLFSYDVKIGDMHRYVDSPYGLRTIGYLSDGEVWGDLFTGKILPGGGDWCVLRRDGVSIPDVRAIIRTDDGEEIYMSYTGKMYTGENGYENYRNAIFPDKNYICTAVSLETESEKYRWLNTKQCFGIGQVDRTKMPVKVQYDIYALTSLPDEE